jgi:IS4 transposase
MQDKNIIKSAFFQFFRPIFSKNLRKQLIAYGVDKYVKKLTTLQFLQALIYAQLNNHQSLREISNSFNDNRFSKQMGIDSFSASQISRRLRDLPTKILHALFTEVVSKAVKQLSVQKANRELGALRIIDSSTSSLCLTRYPWAVFRKTKSGVKIHLSLKFLKGATVPEEAIITPAKQNDRKQMDNLVTESKDILNVFDRGYVDYQKFDYYCQEGIRFVSRLKENAIVEVIKVRSVDQNSPVKSDLVVRLGTSVKTMKHNLRLIEVTDTQGNPIKIITNDFQLSSEELGEIYRHRWQIELFFKWMKQHCCVKHFYGLSQQAVENQIYLALITYCLLQLLKLRTAYQGSLLQILTLLTTCLYDLFELFVEKLSRKRRCSKGRRRIDYEKIYEMTERQVRQGETQLLYETAYDPVIL